ncbi:hypothetical protein UFOVP97_33 [uncultured Caudovirales phage]|uniref:Uncharacterized protein n=1 Tax=uncultured Caudovirales phage TaxID=2100421 RepID=A0A6J5L3H5_9CAUD|nr:hypothetical protein UFOVP97_33 [uncultured Caudovirales phage]CAB4134380.1 hypothetical protein UFOVP268_51 [uncultured Caudovirales phage]
MSYGIRLVPDTLRSLAFGVIGVNYAPIGTVFLHPMRIISIKNLTNANLLFSFDGVNDNEVVPAEAGVVYDLCTNRVGTLGAMISIGTRVYVKQSGVPTAGSVYVTTWYGYGE